METELKKEHGGVERKGAVNMSHTLTSIETIMVPFTSLLLSFSGTSAAHHVGEVITSVLYPQKRNARVYQSFAKPFLIRNSIST